MQRMSLMLLLDYSLKKKHNYFEQAMLRQAPAPTPEDGVDLATGDSNLHYAYGHAYGKQRPRDRYCT